MAQPRSGQPDGIALRTALLLVASVEVALIAGILTYVAAHNWALAVLAGGGSVAGAAAFFDRIVAHT